MHLEKIIFLVADGYTFKETNIFSEELKVKLMDLFYIKA